MYVTAKRVRSPRGATGLNVALYRHAGTDLPDDAWTLAPAQLLNLVTTEYQGTRYAERVDVAPGGNSVDGFLDLVAPDETPASALRHALHGLRPLAVQTRRAHLRSGAVCAEFSVNLGAPDVGAAFDELAGAALALYERPPERTWLRFSPLRIDVSHDTEGWHFVLDDESAARVREAGGQPARAHVRHEIASDFRRIYGELYPWVAQWVTNLSREKLLELGGTRIVADGNVVDEWPKRPERAG